MYLLRSLALALFLVAPPPPLPTAPVLKHKLVGHAGTVRGAAFSPQGKTLATVSDDGHINVWDVSSGKAVVSARTARRFGSVEYSRDGKMLLTAGIDAAVCLWDAGTGKEIKTFSGHAGQVFVACFTPDNKHIVSGGADNLTRIWDVATTKQVRTLTSGTVYAVAVSPDGKYVVTGGVQYPLMLWETATGKKVREMPGHTGVIVWLTFSPDGRTIASASYDHTIRLWELRTGKERVRITAANSPRVLMFSRDGRFLAEGNYDGGTRLFDSGSGKALFVDTSIRSSLYAVALSRDGWYLCGGGTSGKLNLWDVSALARKRGGVTAMTAATFDDHFKALGSEDAGESYRAVVALSAPDAVKHFANRFKPPRPLTPAAQKRTPQLLRALESDDDDTWRKAADELAGFGPAIVPALRKALASADDADVKLRLIVTIRRADSSGSQELRLLRAIEALERLRSPEAVKLLEGLARGSQSKLVASEARQTLARLRQRR